MRELLWGAIASIVSRPRVANWLIRRAQRTPYYPIASRDGADVYMDRWWLLNPYSEQVPARWPLPSIRIHHIMRPDNAPHQHDHPWNARTVILRGWYHEVRQDRFYVRAQGYTGRLLFGEYHHISEVSPGGVWTLFFTWRKRGTWGFNVDGVKVPWRTYLGLETKP